MRARIIIGKNFGDEGKGLATDYFAAEAERAGEDCVVVRHNGGAQAGHTVETDGARFVFHQLSSGSFRGARTLWASAFLPDLYKLEDELRDFSALYPPPHIYACGECAAVIIDDVLINMALETLRGGARHGSCGMGINEAVLRASHKDYRLTLFDIAAMDARGLYAQLKRIRAEYSHDRLAELGISPRDVGEYGEMLADDGALSKTADIMQRALDKVEIVQSERAILRAYPCVIFENAQGLLLDSENAEYAPHLTPSRTGLANPVKLMRDCGIDETRAEAIYVTRTYVTRHGAGKLNNECDLNLPPDITNAPNPWQGALRYARHGDLRAFARPALDDLSAHGFRGEMSVLITHLNETGGKILLADEDAPAEIFARRLCGAGFKRVYASAHRQSNGIYELNIASGDYYG